MLEGILIGLLTNLIWVLLIGWSNLFDESFVRSK